MEHVMLKKSALEAVQHAQVMDMHHLALFATNPVVFVKLMQFAVEAARLVLPRNRRQKAQCVVKQLECVILLKFAMEAALNVQQMNSFQLEHLVTMLHRIALARVLIAQLSHFQLSQVQ